MLLTKGRKVGIRESSCGPDARRGSSAACNQDRAEKEPWAEVLAPSCSPEHTWSTCGSLTTLSVLLDLEQDRDDLYESLEVKGPPPDSPSPFLTPGPVCFVPAILSRTFFFF